VISEDVALLFEFVGVYLTTGKSLLENALSFWVGVWTVALWSNCAGTIVEVVAAVPKRADRPDDDQNDKDEKQEEEDAAAPAWSTPEKLLMKSDWWHDVTSFPTYSRSRRRGDKRDRRRITIL